MNVIEPMLQKYATLKTYSWECLISEHHKHFFVKAASETLVSFISIRRNR